MATWTSMLLWSCGAAPTQTPHGVQTSSTSGAVIQQKRVGWGSLIGDEILPSYTGDYDFKPLYTGMPIFKNHLENIVVAIFCSATGLLVLGVSSWWKSTATAVLPGFNGMSAKGALMNCSVWFTHSWWMGCFVAGSWLKVVGVVLFHQ